jgi:hypothetical protein
MKVGDMTALPHPCSPICNERSEFHRHVLTHHRRTMTPTDAPTRQEIHRKNTTVLVQIADD